MILDKLSTQIQNYLDSFWGQQSFVILGIGVFGFVLLCIVFWILARKAKVKSTHAKQLGFWKPEAKKVNQDASPFQKAALPFVSYLKDLISSGNSLTSEQCGKIRELLLRADFGVPATNTIVERVEAASRQRGQLDSQELTALLRAEVVAMTSRQAKEFASESDDSLRVIVLVGVNGAGKTTTAAKLAGHAKEAGQKPLLVAADTFRAAAVEQLQTWAQRIDCPIVFKEAGADPAAVAFEGVKKAKELQADLVVIDTAGRLQNKKELMDELSKVLRSTHKSAPEARVQTLIVVDGTTGQNALGQIEAFSLAAPLDGIIVTKLDGTAKGGVVVAAAIKFNIPICYVGLGESIADLKVFDPISFSEGIFPYEA